MLLDSIWSALNVGGRIVTSQPAAYLMPVTKLPIILCYSRKIYPKGSGNPDNFAKVILGFVIDS